MVAVLGEGFCRRKEREGDEDGGEEGVGKEGGHRII